MTGKDHPSTSDADAVSPWQGRGLLVVVATYNERENLPRLVEAILAAVPSATLLVIDDQSPDGTGEWAQEHAKHESRLRVMSRAGKLGLGSAILEAMRLAIREQFTLLLNLDADFSHDPAAIPTLVRGMFDAEERPTSDVMIGSRYVPGGGTRGWPWHRRWMSRGVNLYARWWLRLSVRDCSSGFRCFRVDMLEKLDLAAVRAKGYAFHEEALWRLKRAGARLRETPITFVDRRYGESKINPREALAALTGILKWGFEDRLRRPKPARLAD